MRKHQAYNKRGFFFCSSSLKCILVKKTGKNLKNSAGQMKVDEIHKFVYDVHKMTTTWSCYSLRTVRAARPKFYVCEATRSSCSWAEKYNVVD